MIDRAEDEYFGGPGTEKVIVEGSEEGHPWRQGAVSTQLVSPQP